MFATSCSRVLACLHRGLTSCTRRPTRAALQAVVVMVLSEVSPSDELLSYHRNCATSDTIMTNTCETYTNIILKREVCSCDWAYCNTASGATPLCAARPSAVLTSLLVLGGALRARVLV